VTGRASGAPLIGIRVVELAGIGPGPFACTMLADLGCDVIRIERLLRQESALPDQLTRLGVRGRTTLAIDLKTEDGRRVARALIDAADVVLEGFRPGVAERLGVGPEEFEESNPGLVYTRLTGWGQEGPYAAMAGHDINYIGITGALAAIGERATPLPPLNLLGDYAGGSMFAVIGILSALVERAATGRGRVIDAAMIDGVSSLMTPVNDMQRAGLWTEERASNMLDGGAPFYRVYGTSDGRFMAVGALEPVFYSALVEGLGLEESELPNRFDPLMWPELESSFAAVFSAHPRTHWEGVFDGTDACVTPVLTMTEAVHHPHNVARRSAEAPAPTALTPRFDGQALEAADHASGWEEAKRVLVLSGISEDAIETLVASEVIAHR